MAICDLRRGNRVHVAGSLRCSAQNLGYSGRNAITPNANRASGAARGLTASNANRPDTCTDRTRAREADSRPARPQGSALRSGPRAARGATTDRSAPHQGFAPTRTSDNRLATPSEGGSNRDWWRRAGHECAGHRTGRHAGSGGKTVELDEAGHRKGAQTVPPARSATATTQTVGARRQSKPPRGVPL